MKPIKIIIPFLALITAVLFTLPSYAAQGKHYEMACRSGTGMQAYFLMKRNGGFNLEIYYKKAVAGAKSGNLQAGTCAWMDRPINNNEPAKLIKNIAAGMLDSTELYFRHGDLASFIVKDNQGKSRKDLEGLLMKLKNGQEFRLMVRRDDNKDYFTIGKIVK